YNMRNYGTFSSSISLNGRKGNIFKSSIPSLFASLFDRNVDLVYLNNNVFLSAVSPFGLHGASYTFRRTGTIRFSQPAAPCAPSTPSSRKTGTKFSRYRD